MRMRLSGCFYWYLLVFPAKYIHFFLFSPPSYSFASDFSHFAFNHYLFPPKILFLSQLQQQQQQFISLTRIHTSIISLTTWSQWYTSFRKKNKASLTKLKTNYFLKYTLHKQQQWHTFISFSLEIYTNSFLSSAFPPFLYKKTKQIFNIHSTNKQQTNKINLSFIIIVKRLVCF